MLLKKKFGKAGSDVCTFCSLSREQLQVEDLICLCPFSQTLWKNLESLWYEHMKEVFTLYSIFKRNDCKLFRKRSQYFK